MSDAVPLPSRPHLDYYRSLARDLAEAATSADGRRWAERFVAALSARTSIERFGATWTDDRIVDWIAKRWAAFLEQQIAAKERPPQLSDAQFFLARLHGFASWPRFAHHVETTADAGSLTAAFEAAADAIVSGDLDTLRALVDTHPELVHKRSTREHRSTLLHYVSANGIEDFRQKTPPNIVAIAALLLDRGSDVNAESEAYGGHSTTLGLAATSVHPEQAGVQMPLLELLLARGAKIEQRGQAGNGHGAVVGCLANGQGAAARFLAQRGAVLDLEGAAGVGRVDVLETFFDEHGALANGAMPAQLESGFMYAAGYGRDEATRFLLAHGANPDARRGGETALHWTTFGPHVGTATQLLAAGASVGVRDDRFKATPLDWALYRWVHVYDAVERERGYTLIERLIAAGAAPDLARFGEKTRASLERDARMMAILRSRTAGGTAPDGR
jgi:ankyrin repeat protein